MPSSTEYTQCHRHNKPDLTFYYDVGANSGTVNDKLQFGNSLIQAISGKLTNSSASRKVGNFAFNITRYDNKDSAKDGKAETTGTLTFFFTNKNEQVEGSIIVSQSRQDPIDNNGDVVIAPNKTETLPIIGGTIKYLGKQGHITITTNTTTEREVKVYFDKQYNYKRTQDLTFYFSVNNNVTNINTLTLTTTPANSVIETCAGNITSVYCSDSEIPNANIIIGRFIFNGIKYNTDNSLIDENGLQTYILKNSNGDEDSISIIFYKKSQKNAQGTIVQPPNEKNKASIVNGTGKYLGIKGILEVISDETLERTVNVYFDK